MHPEESASTTPQTPNSEHDWSILPGGRPDGQSQKESHKHQVDGNGALDPPCVWRQERKREASDGGDTWHAQEEVLLVTPTVLTWNVVLEIN